MEVTVVLPWDETGQKKPKIHGFSASPLVAMQKEDIHNDIVTPLNSKKWSNPGFEPGTSCTQSRNPIVSSGW